MNAHHKKQTHRPSAPRHPRHFSSATLQLPLDGSLGSSPLSKAIERVPFGWQLDLVLPSSDTDHTSSLIDELKAEIDQTARYQVARAVNLATLLEPNFLNSYVRRGSLVAISLDRGQDGDIVAIDGRGRLVLSLCKDTYEVLGLPGRASMHGSFRQRFIVEISLVDTAFRAGKPGFERVKRLLREWPRETQLFEQLQSASAPSAGKTFDLVMSYVDDKGHAQAIEFAETLELTSRSPIVSSRELARVSIPASTALPSRTNARESTKTTPQKQKRQRTSSGAQRRTVKDDEVWWDAFREWRGLATLGGAEEALLTSSSWRDESDRDEQDGDDDDDHDEEEWGISRRDSVRGSVTTLSVNGLLHPQSMTNIVRKALESPSFLSIPFLSLVLRPFPNSPISHTSAASQPVVGTGVRPNGKKRKRGRGRGEEEEADRDKLEAVGGWEVVLRPSRDSGVDWWMWEGQ